MILSLWNGRICDHEQIRYGTLYSDFCSERVQYYAYGGKLTSTSFKRLIVAHSPNRFFLVFTRVLNS